MTWQVINFRQLWDVYERHVLAPAVTINATKGKFVTREQTYGTPVVATASASINFTAG